VIPGTLRCCAAHPPVRSYPDELSAARGPRRIAAQSFVFACAPCGGCTHQCPMLKGSCSATGIVKSSHARAQGRLEARVRFGKRGLWAHSAQGDVTPDGVTLGADLSIGGTGMEVSTRTEVVADGAERSQEPLGVLGGF
jgi:hypothetical protein